MLCDCGNELKNGSFITELGNEIEYSECEDCGLIEVCGMDIEKETK